MKNSNNKRHPARQSVNSAVKAICHIMRRSHGAGALQDVPERAWILVLRILDERRTREAGEAGAVNSDSRPPWRAVCGRKIAPPRKILHDFCCIPTKTW